MEHWHPEKPVTDTSPFAHHLKHPVLDMKPHRIYTNARRTNHRHHDNTTTLANQKR